MRKASGFSQIFYTLVVASFFVAIIAGLFFYQQTKINNLALLLNSNPVPTKPATGFIPQFTPTPTLPVVPSDWKTYTNKSLGFEFKYPNTLPYNVVDIYDYKSLLTFENWIKDLETESPASNELGSLEGFSYLVKNKININGKPAYYYESIGMAGPKQTIIIDLGNNKIADITFIPNPTQSPDNPVSETNKKLITQILSTFKFVSNQENPTGWTTFFDDFLGLTYQIPNDWNVVGAKPGNIDLELSSNNKCRWFDISVVSTTVPNLKEYVSLFYQGENMKSLLSLKQISIDNQDTVTVGPTGIAEVRTIYINTKDRLYRINEWVESPGGIAPGNAHWETVCKNYNPPTDQILSTLKFTN